MAASGATIAAASRAGASSPDVAPPAKVDWLRSDGTVDFDRMPALIPILDSSGEICGYIAREELLRPPTDHERAAIVKRQETLEKREIMTQEGETLVTIDPPVPNGC